MSYNNLLLSKENHIAVVTINNPKSLNALNSDVLNDLDKVFDDLQADKEVRAVVLTGEGRAFVAGADITEMANLNEQEGRAFGAVGTKVFRKIENLSKPVIAAVNGFALGGGCELAMACDIRIASDKAKFGQPEVGLGITPGFSGTQRLARLVGMGMAKELIFTANVIGADEALRIGLVNKVVPLDELMNEVMAMAKMIVSKAPLAIEYSKKAMDKGFDMPIDQAIEVELDYFGKCFATEDQKNGMQAFMNKEKVNYQGK